jgi:hypothetical protein
VKGRVQGSVLRDGPARPYGVETQGDQSAQVQGCDTDGRRISRLRLLSSARDGVGGGGRSPGRDNR